MLASASPRRRELLDQLVLRYRVNPADIDETRREGESPRLYVQRMAREKACAVATHYPDGGHAILAADTTVLIDENVLGKPRDHFDGMEMLAMLSGRSHTVLTAIHLHCPSGAGGAVVETRVDFVKLSPATCEAYLATDEPWDKAGAYAIQGLAGAFVRSIQGSYSNVVGLPLCETWQLLNANRIATILKDAP